MGTVYQLKRKLPPEGRQQGSGRDASYAEASTAEEFFKRVFNDSSFPFRGVDNGTYIRHYGHMTEVVVLEPIAAARSENEVVGLERVAPYRFRTLPCQQMVRKYGIRQPQPLRHSIAAEDVGCSRERSIPLVTSFPYKRSSS